MSSRITLLLTLAALLLASLPAWAAPMQMTLGGYLQARYTDMLGTGDSSFTTPRAYILIQATDEEHVFAQLLYEGRSNTLQHAFGEYRTDTLTGRIGLAPIPFGYENPVTSARLITMERSQVSNMLVGAFALDRGAWVVYAPGRNLNLTAGLVNGEPFTTTTDTNNHKNIVGRLGYTLPSGGEVGVSIYDGEMPGAPPTTMDLLGVDLEMTRGPFTIIGEYIQGDTGATEPDGAYVTVAYQAPGSNVQPYARYDIFDPDTAAPDDYTRLTLGCALYLNPKSKVSLEFQSIDDDANPIVDGNLAAQYQIIF